MKSAKILHVLAPNFLGGELPEFLESIYKIDTGSDHVEKLRGDRPRELGDYALKKRTITSKIEDLPLLRTGGLIRKCLESATSAGRPVVAVRTIPSACGSPAVYVHSPPNIFRQSPLPHTNVDHIAVAYGAQENGRRHVPCDSLVSG